MKKGFEVFFVFLDKLVFLFKRFKIKRECLNIDPCNMAEFFKIISNSM